MAPIVHDQAKARIESYIFGSQSRCETRPHDVRRSDEPDPIALRKRRKITNDSSCSFLAKKSSQYSPSVGIPHAARQETFSLDCSGKELGNKNASSVVAAYDPEASFSLATDPRCTACDQFIEVGGEIHTFPLTAPHILDTVCKMYGLRHLKRRNTTSSSSVNSEPEFCRPCFEQIYALHLCWNCGETITRVEERVRCGWAWWHWSCVCCIDCRAPVSPPHWRSSSSEGHAQVSSRADDTLPREEGFIIPENSIPTCKACLRKRDIDQEKPSTLMVRRGWKRRRISMPRMARSPRENRSISASSSRSSIMSAKATHQEPKVEVAKTDRGNVSVQHRFDLDAWFASRKPVGERDHALQPRFDNGNGKRGQRSTEAGGSQRRKMPKWMEMLPSNRKRLPQL